MVRLTIGTKSGNASWSELNTVPRLKQSLLPAYRKFRLNICLGRLVTRPLLDFIILVFSYVQQDEGVMCCFFIPTHLPFIGDRSTCNIPHIYSEYMVDFGLIGSYLDFVHGLSINISFCRV